MDAALHYERSSDFCGLGCACYGWCYRDGRGVPIDLIIATELFQKSADLGDLNGANSIGVSLERGERIESDVDRAVWYYRLAASGLNREGMYNFGRCLEYGKGIGRDLIRAAKYYRMSADLDHAAAQNSFGICLERGIGVKANQTLAAEYYQKAADQGHPDGANNLGFCLEHGLGVERNLRLAAEYYKFAADHGHAEGRVNYGRWLRLLGKWEGPDRSADTSCQPPSRDDLAAKFIGGLDDPKHFDADSTKFLESVQRLKESRIKRRMISSAPAELKVETQIKITPFFGISFKRSSNGTLIAVKRSESDAGSQRIHRGAFIQRSLSHPLLIGFHEFIPQSELEKTTIITEFAGNGTLADHLPITAEREKSGLSGTNRIVQIIVGIVLGMRYLHSLGIIHRNLNPDTI
jgi:TPR repeat protein